MIQPHKPIAQVANFFDRFYISDKCFDNIIINLYHNKFDKAVKKIEEHSNPKINPAYFIGEKQLLSNFINIGNNTEQKEKSIDELDWNEFIYSRHSSASDRSLNGKYTKQIKKILSKEIALIENGKQHDTELVNIYYYMHNRDAYITMVEHIIKSMDRLKFDNLAKIPDTALLEYTLRLIEHKKMVDAVIIYKKTHP